jgi:hypothetical protein
MSRPPAALVGVGGTDVALGVAVDVKVAVVAVAVAGSEVLVAG